LAEFYYFCAALLILRTLTNSVQNSECREFDIPIITNFYISCQNVILGIWTDVYYFTGAT